MRRPPGTDAVPFLDGDRLRVLVSCRADAGKLDVPVSYAIAVAPEIGADVAIDADSGPSGPLIPVGLEP